MNRHSNFDWSSVGLDFGNWEEEKIWALDLPVELIDIEELLWHFAIPYWTNDAGERWGVSLWDVIGDASDASLERKRVDEVDASYPIDIFENKGRWFVLDGLHRLLQEYKNGKKQVRVRKIPHERFVDVKSEYLIELPKGY